VEFSTLRGVRELRERLGLEVRCFGILEPPRGPSPPRPPAPALVPTISQCLVSDRDPVRRLPNGSRTCAEARVVYRDSDEDADEIPTPTRRFSLFEITSGLPDNSREADERFDERRLHEIRSRVKAARTVVSKTPELAETVQKDWRKAARFYARFGITEAMFRRGVAIIDPEVETS
jgi:hypothetical protein